MSPDNDNKDNWAVVGKGSTVYKLLNKCFDRQKVVVDRLPEKERKKLYGFACQFIVKGKESEGGIFNLWFCSEGIQPKPPDAPLRNYVILSYDTFLNLFTPDYDSLKAITPNGERLAGFDALSYYIENGMFKDILPTLKPVQSFNNAMANGSIEFGGVMPDIDSAKWGEMVNEVLYEIAFPMVVEGLMETTKSKKKR
jgi:hypothetical protein